MHCHNPCHPSLGPNPPPVLPSLAHECPLPPTKMPSHYTHSLSPSPLPPTMCCLAQSYLWQPMQEWDVAPMGQVGMLAQLTLEQLQMLFYVMFATLFADLGTSVPILLRIIIVLSDKSCSIMEGKRSCVYNPNNVVL